MKTCFGFCLAFVLAVLDDAGLELSHRATELRARYSTFQSPRVACLIKQH